MEIRAASDATPNNVIKSSNVGYPVVLRHVLQSSWGQEIVVSRTRGIYIYTRPSQPKTKVSHNRVVGAIGSVAAWAAFEAAQLVDPSVQTGRTYVAAS